MEQITSEKPRQGAERELRLFSYVGRWQIVQVNRRQTLTDHLYHVALLAWRLVEDCGLRSKMDLNMEDVFREALLHDLPETLSGDIPSPVHQKVKQNPEWKSWLTARVTEFFPWYEEKPTSAVKYIVSVCDLLEACLFLKEEVEMGNRYVVPHLSHLSDRMAEFLDRPIVSYGNGCVMWGENGAEETATAVRSMGNDIKAWVNATLERSTEPAKVLLNP